MHDHRHHNAVAWSMDCGVKALGPQTSHYNLTIKHHVHNRTSYHQEILIYLLAYATAADPFGFDVIKYRGSDFLTIYVRPQFAIIYFC